MSSKTLHSTLRMDSIQNNIVSTSSFQNNQFQHNNANIKRFNYLSQLNLLREIKNTGSVSSLSPAFSTNANDLNNQQELSTNKASTDALAFNLANQPQQNESFKIGDYIFFKPNINKEANINDSFNSAFNLKKKKFFYWKKFEKENYLKKLEAFFIMENSELIYNFSEIILEENTNDDVSTNVYVIFEPHYGDLHAYMKVKKRLDETEAKEIFKQCVKVISECHEKGIIVGDIKLKKFVFVDVERTKIALSGLEDCFILNEDAPNDLIKSQQGCPAYVSPEVLNSRQTGYSGRLSDSWSLGIILYTLLIGRYPFHHQAIFAMFIKIVCGQFQIPSNIELSIEVKNLLKSLIRVKPNERLLPCQVLDHKWFKNKEDRGFENVLQQAPSQTRNYLDETDSLKSEPLAKKIKSNQYMNTEDDRTVPNTDF